MPSPEQLEQMLRQWGVYEIDHACPTPGSCVCTTSPENERGKLARSLLAWAQPDRAAVREKIRQALVEQNAILDGSHGSHGVSCHCVSLIAALTGAVWGEEILPKRWCNHLAWRQNPGQPTGDYDYLPHDSVVTTRWICCPLCDAPRPSQP